MRIGALMLIFAAGRQLSALFTLLTIVAYLGWYTPAKRSRGARKSAPWREPSAPDRYRRRGRVSPLGWILFGIIFFGRYPTSWRWRGPTGGTTPRCVSDAARAR